MWFELRPKIPPDVKAYRREVTKKYGIITVVAAFAFIVAIALVNLITCKCIGKSGRGWAYTRTRLDSPAVGSVRKRISSFRIPLTVLVWTVGLWYVTFMETNHDVLFVVKRLGRVSVALMPPLYFLTLRPTPLPRTFYLQLLPFHKWISRAVVVLSLVHGIWYTYAYWQMDKMFKLCTAANISGIAASVGFCLIGATSLPWFRRAFYAVFYTIHYILAWVCVILVACHAKPDAYWYMAACALLLCWQVVYRMLNSGQVRLPVQFVSDSLYMISIPYDKLPTKLRAVCTAGAHVRISKPLYNPLNWFESSHPYTVASLPHEDHMKLVIRKTQFPIKLRQFYSIYGPFNSLPDDFVHLVKSGGMKRALFVIGGSGIAFGAPVFRFLKENGVKVKLLWAIKDIRETAVLSQLSLSDDIRDIEIYISPKRISGLGLRNMKSTLDFFLNYARVPNEDENLDVLIEDNYCSGSESKPLLSQTSNAASRVDYASFDDQTALNIMNHRLTLNNRLKYFLCGLSINDNECSCLDYVVDIKPEGSWVITSGAHDMVRETKCWAEENGFSFFQEEFAL